jgi:hypothetical protein
MASSQNCSGAAAASAFPPRSVFLGSPSPSPCLELVHMPIETLGDNRAKAVENSHIGASTLPHTPPEDSAAATGFCRSAADTTVRSLSLPPSSIAQTPSCLGPLGTPPSEGGRAATRQSKIWPFWFTRPRAATSTRAYHASAVFLPC